MNKVVAGSVALGGMRNSIRFPQLMRAPLFDGYSDEEKACLLDAAWPHFYRQGTDVLLQDEGAPGVFMVAQGQAEVIYMSASGASSPLLIARVGMSLGLAEALSELPCAATCRAAAGSCMLFFETETIFELAKDRRFIRNVARNMQEAMRRYNQFRAAEKDMTVAQKVAYYLLELQGADNRIRHSQGFLADAVGCSRQTVNKMLGILRSDGIVSVDKGVIHILSTEALMDWKDRQAL